MNIDQISKLFFLAFIKIYRFFLSPFFGRECKFYPTCSQYGIEALRKHKFLVSVFLITRRIIFCHPWSIGGYKTVPNIFSVKRYLTIRLFSLKNKLYN